MLIGSRLGPYEVLAKLGKGGMGQVYRATDIKLKRQVAIKILPPSLAAGSNRLARFQREAEVLASLNHPNIAAIYGLEESGGNTALVMELVEGEDLSQRLARGAIPFDEALPIAKQIADALGAAHEQGIIHRDLKPANIKVRADSTVKVLDFGLAKALEAGLGTAGDVTKSPTLTSPVMVTSAGTIVGTAAYMSPEQARGRSVDRRTDIWAFGSVLYEMLAGRRPFDGSDVTDVLAAVIRTRRHSTRCHRRCPRQYVACSGGVLKRTSPGASTRCATRVSRSMSRTRRPQSSSRSGGQIHGMADGRCAPRDTGPRLLRLRARTELEPCGGAACPCRVESRPCGKPRPAFSLRPAVTSGVGRHGRWQPHRLRRCGRRNDPVVRAVARWATGKCDPGTAGAHTPFLSPDNQWVGFLADGVIRKVPVAGGPVVAVADLKSTDRVSPSALVAPGTDFYGPAGARTAPSCSGDTTTGCGRCPTQGGTPSRVTTTHGGGAHRLPHHLPGGRGVLLTVRDLRSDVAVLPRGATEPRLLIESATDGR